MCYKSNRYQFQNHCLYTLHGPIPDYCLYRNTDKYSHKFIDGFSDLEVKTILNYFFNNIDIPEFIKKNQKIPDRDKLKIISDFISF